MIISKKTPKEIVLKLGAACEAKDCSVKAACCSYSTGFLAEEDLQKIAAHLKISEQELKDKYLEEKRLFNTLAWKPKSLKQEGKPYGPCVFLDKGKACSIHTVKPTQCRISSCKGYGAELLQWFYLNHLVNPDDPQSIREYAEYIKFNEPIAGGTLEEIVPDPQQLKKILSYEKFSRED